MSRSNHLWYRYGLDEDTYLAMLESENGLGASCKAAPRIVNGIERPLARVDRPVLSALSLPKSAEGDSADHMICGVQLTGNPTTRDLGRLVTTMKGERAGYPALAVKTCPFLKRIATAILTQIAVTATRASGV